MEVTIPQEGGEGGHFLGRPLAAVTIYRDVVTSLNRPPSGPEDLRLPQAVDAAVQSDS